MYAGCVINGHQVQVGAQKNIQDPQNLKKIRI